MSFTIFSIVSKDNSFVGAIFTITYLYPTICWGLHELPFNCRPICISRLWLVFVFKDAYHIISSSILGYSIKFSSILGYLIIFLGMHVINSVHNFFLNIGFFHNIFFNIGSFHNFFLNIGLFHIFHCRAWKKILLIQII